MCNVAGMYVGSTRDMVIIDELISLVFCRGEIAGYLGFSTAEVSDFDLIIKWFFLVEPRYETIAGDILRVKCGFILFGDGVVFVPFLGIRLELLV